MARFNPASRYVLALTVEAANLICKELYAQSMRYLAMGEPGIERALDNLRFAIFNAGLAARNERVIVSMNAAQIAMVVEVLTEVYESEGTPDEIEELAHYTITGMFAQVEMSDALTARAVEC